MAIVKPVVETGWNEKQLSGSTMKDRSTELRLAGIKQESANVRV